MAQVSIKHVEKVYPAATGRRHKPKKGNANLKVTEEGVLAVEDFNLEIADGEFIVLVGPSGCGKSTMLRMVAGLEEITRGEIYIDDKLVNDVMPRDRDIAMVFQNYALYPHKTVRGNMEYPLKLRKVPKDEMNRRVEEAAKILGITALLDRKPKALSGGQRQRVAIGRAIVREPQVFLMDEPLSNLDAKLRNQMRAEIIKLRQRIDTTFIYVTHDQTEAMTLGDRIVIMKDGFIQQIGTPQQVFDTPSNLFVAGFIGTPQMNFFEAQLCREGDQYHLELNGRRLEIAPEKQRRLLQYDVQSQSVTAGIRPEHVLLTDDLGFTGQVEVTEMMGSNTHLHLRFGADEVVVLVPDGDEPVREFSLGETVHFTFHAERIHLFSRETGHNLEHDPQEALTTSAQPPEVPSEPEAQAVAEAEAPIAPAATPEPDAAPEPETPQETAPTP